jgi:hypothetical protein
VTDTEISSAICLPGMLLFALTGFTLNRAAQIEAHARVEQRSAMAPPALLHVLARTPHAGRGVLIGEHAETPGIFIRSIFVLGVLLSAD